MRTFLAISALTCLLVVGYAMIKSNKEKKRRDFEPKNLIEEDLPDISHRVMCVTRHEIDTSIQTMHREVVEFIKWYNTQKP